MRSFVRTRPSWRERFLDSSTSPEKADLPSSTDVILVGEDEVAATPDLLFPLACIRTDKAWLQRMFRSAFSAGDTEGRLKRSMEHFATGDSSWNPELFDEGLFLDDLISRCMKVHVDGDENPLNRKHLAKIISSPPRDAATLDYRHAIVSELANSPKSLSKFEKIYTAIVDIRRALEKDEPVAIMDSRRRRFGLFTALRDAVEAMTDSFQESPTGLNKIGIFAEKLKASPGYRRVTELISQEQHLSTINVRMQLGADGRVRKFEVLEVEENSNNAFYKSPFRRLFTRLWMRFRGYRLTETELLERWFDSVYDDVEPFLPAMLQLMGDMEFYLSSIAFKKTCERRGLDVCLPEVGPFESTPLDIENLFNPHLFAQDLTPVCTSISSNDTNCATVLTGPNSGGKTRLLQSIGIAHALGQCGFYVPAKSARMGRSSGLFLSLIEKAEMDQSEGRLGMELMRIRRLFESSKPGVLVILDELCSGTDPSEGEEIFRLVLSLLGELGARVIVATHFLAFAKRLQSESQDIPLHFLQVELNAEGNPTYQFSLGVADSSLAKRTATRLGVTDGELRALVRRNRADN